MTQQSPERVTNQRNASAKNGIIVAMISIVVKPIDTALFHFIHAAAGAALALCLVSTRRSWCFGDVWYGNSLWSCSWWWGQEWGQG